MTLHFGKKIIGEAAYEKAALDHAEGREHFGPKVIGERKPFKESVAGKRVVSEQAADLAQKTIEATGAPTPLDDLKVGEVERLCDALKIPYKARTPKRFLIERIHAKYAEQGAVAPIDRPSAASSVEEQPPDDD